jgi:response regulator RpfG family c-di-GMP phosphodiesterase
MHAPQGAPRVIVCDYNSLLQSITGLLRVSGYAVFQAYDGEAAQQLCEFMPDIDLLVLNTEGTGVDTPGLVRTMRRALPSLPILPDGRARDEHYCRPPDRSQPMHISLGGHPQT